MAQADGVVSNASGAAVRADLNNQLAAVFTNHSGATEPTTTYAYQWWADSTTGLLKIRNAANSAWVTVGTMADVNLGLLAASGGTLTGALLAAAGSASTPSIAFSGDTNTGIYSPGSDQVAISTGGTQRLAVDSSGNITIDTNTLYVDAANNRVGIGTTSPSYPLQVDTTGTGTAAGDNTSIYVQSQASGRDCNIRFGDNVNASARIGYLSNNLYFYVNTSERARIDSSGRLLVGTSSAEANYRISTIGYTPSVQVKGAFPGGTLALTTTDNNTVLWLTNAATQSAADSGLGVISFNGYDGTNYLAGARISALTDGTCGANDLPTRLVFSTTADGASSPTERMRISNTGRAFLVSTGDGLAVSTTLAAGTTSLLFYGRHSGTAGVADSGTASFLVYTNGNVQNTNNSYGAISDLKLKENIVDANSQWDDIKALRPVNYNFKEGQTHTQLGLIAQEVELVSPGLVTESPDRDEEGNDLGTVTKSVNYSVLYMKAVKALQEAMERIETLEAKVAALESA